ncbi:hypothetical protein [Nocardia sp. NPDC050710]|uniref:hypothetical protein n=1 Tax=Nocardia sp. NPDC050710 TaxID=3157220 RepID=UPI00340CD74B
MNLIVIIGVVVVVFVVGMVGILVGVLRRPRSADKHLTVADIQARLAEEVGRDGLADEFDAGPTRAAFDSHTDLDRDPTGTESDLDATAHPGAPRDAAPADHAAPADTAPSSDTPSPLDTVLDRDGQPSDSSRTPSR